MTGGEPSDTLSLIRQGTAQQLPCSDASFDVVFSSHALVELNDVPPALREAHRVLKPNGRLVLVLSTSIMAWVRLMSLLMFETHHHVGAFLRFPSRENPAGCLQPPIVARSGPHGRIFCMERTPVEITDLAIVRD